MARAGGRARAGPATGRARLQKLLAAAGVCSRRAAEALVSAGRVSVNGKPARLGDSADPERDEITLDGERLALETKQYWIVHKPPGVLTTLRDTHGRPTIKELLPQVAARVFPVGRLDRDTEGLVLLTNDGALTHALLHPSHGVEREYRVIVRGELRPGGQRRLEKGLKLDDGITAPSRVSRVHFDADAGTTRFQLTIREGRKRQIRRSLRALGHPVRALRRERMGPLWLGKLARGAAREATRAERRALERLRDAFAPAAGRRDGSRAGSSGRKAGARKGKRKASRGRPGDPVSH